MDTAFSPTDQERFTHTFDTHEDAEQEYCSSGSPFPTQQDGETSQRTPSCSLSPPPLLTPSPDSANSAAGLAETFARMRAAEQYLLDQLNRHHSSKLSPSSSSLSPNPPSRNKRTGPCTPALLRALKCIALGLICVTVLVALIIWNEQDSHNQPMLDGGVTAVASLSHPKAVWVEHDDSESVPSRLDTRVFAPFTSVPKQLGRSVIDSLYPPPPPPPPSSVNFTSSVGSADTSGITPASLTPFRRRLLQTCIEQPTTDYLPAPPFFNYSELRAGAIVWQWVFLLYLLLGWSILWVNYVNPLARYLGLKWGLQTNKGVATLLAIVGCLPNFCMNFFSNFSRNGDVGTGAVVGSALLNTFALPAVIYFCLPHKGFGVFWWRAARDLVAFSATTLVMVMVTITEQAISMGESIVLLLLLLVYIYVLAKDKEIYMALGKALYRVKKRQLRLKKSGGGKPLQRFLDGDLFSGFINLCIVVSLVFVIWDNINAAEFLVSANYAISAIFVLEFALKHFAYGFLWYWSEPLHAFDGVLVALIMFEFMFGTGSLASSVRAVRLFRFLRAMRGLRAARVAKNTMHHRRRHRERKNQRALEKKAELERLAAAKAAAIEAEAQAADQALLANASHDPIKQFERDQKLLMETANANANANGNGNGNGIENGETMASAAVGGASSPFVGPVRPRMDEPEPPPPIQVLSEASVMPLPLHLVEQQQQHQQQQQRLGDNLTVNGNVGTSASGGGGISARYTSRRPSARLQTGYDPDGNMNTNGNGNATIHSIMKSANANANGNPSRVSRRGSGMPRTPGTGPTSGTGPNTGTTTGPDTGTPIPAPGNMGRAISEGAVTRSHTQHTQMTTTSSEWSRTGTTFSRTSGSEEVIVISGNMGATAEELALQELQNPLDDDDDDDMDDVEEEEDEEDHWEEVLAEADGKGPKGEIGEPILDSKGNPTGLIRIFVRGVEPRRWSALKPVLNPYRVTLGVITLVCMTATICVTIAIAVKQTIEGKQ